MAEESVVELDSFTAKILQNVDSRRRKLDAILAGHTEPASSPAPVKPPMQDTPKVVPQAPDTPRPAKPFAPVKDTPKLIPQPPDTPRPLKPFVPVKDTPKPIGEPLTLTPHPTPKLVEPLKEANQQLAPELLTLKDKKRLFEKAIEDETAKFNKQKELFNRPVKRLVDWMPVEDKSNNENDAKKNRIHSPTPRADATMVVSTSSSDITFPDLDNDFGEHSPTPRVDATMAVSTSSIDSTFSDLDNDFGEHSPTPRADGTMAVSTSSIDSTFSDLENEFDEHSPTPRDDATMAVSNSSIDITFSALENDFGEHIIKRSSTKVDLSSESMEQEQETLPDKPPRVYAYNEASLQVKQNIDEDSEQEMHNDQPVSNDPDCMDPPPMRTISFYRREQKLKKEAAQSSAQGVDSDVRYLKQNIVSQNIDMKKAFDANMQEKIELLKAEIKEHNRVSNQASSALSQCIGYTDPQLEESRIEAEKLLLVSAERRSACLNQIQRYVSVLRNPNMYCVYAENAPRATVTLANIRVPFKSEFLVSRAKGKQNSTFHFICLLVCKGAVLASKVLASNDNVGQDVLDFEFGGVFDDLTRDFQITLKIFCMEMNKDLKHKENKTFRIKFGTPSKSKGTPNSLTSTSSFQSVGQVYIRLQSMAENKTGLYRMKLDTLSTPLDGYVTMNVAMDVDHRLCAEGFFDIQEESTSFWNLRYFKLIEKELMFWRFKDDVKDKAPLEVIELKNCINPHFALLHGNEREVCMRPHTFVILTVQPPKVSNAEKLLKGGVIHKVKPKRHFISSQSKEDCGIFCEQLNKVLQNIRAWEIDAVRPYSPEEFNRVLMSKD